MDDDFFESVKDFSEVSQDIMLGMVRGDRGFHSSAFVSETPFYGMMTEDENGYASITDYAAATIGDSPSFDVTLKRSDEERFWHFKVSYNENEFSGILRFNTLYNAMGEFSFAFISDREVSEFEDMDGAIPYSNFFVMVK